MSNITIEYLKRVKEMNGLSCTAISEGSGVPFGTVQKVFGGATKTPRKATVDALVNYMQSFSFTVREIDGGQAVREVSMSQGQSADHGIKHPGDYTLDDYYALPDDQRAELIDGTFFVMEAPSMPHQSLINEISTLLSNHIRQAGGPCMVFPAPTDVRLFKDDKTIVQPDIVVLCDRDKLTRRRIEGAPDLLIEILSVSSRTKDNRIKLAKYAEAGVREYWTIDPDRQKIVVYDFEHADDPVIYGFHDRVPVRIWGGSLEIDFHQIYDRIGFLLEAGDTDE